MIMSAPCCSGFLTSCRSEQAASAGRTRTAAAIQCTLRIATPPAGTLLISDPHEHEGRPVVGLSIDRLRRAVTLEQVRRRPPQRLGLGQPAGAHVNIPDKATDKHG